MPEAVILVGTRLKQLPERQAWIRPCASLCAGTKAELSQTWQKPILILSSLGLPFPAATFTGHLLDDRLCVKCKWLVVPVLVALADCVGEVIRQVIVGKSSQEEQMALDLEGESKKPPTEVSPLRRERGQDLDRGNRLKPRARMKHGKTREKRKRQGPDCLVVEI